MLKDMLRAARSGFIVLFEESRWAFTSACRRWEIRQIEKRLNEECRNLGRSYADALAEGRTFDPQTGDNDLLLKQIEFLKEEINYLEEELAAARREFLKSRSGAEDR
ncbi:hypothetical protein [Desulfomicrobium orale]|uniref:Uncharacterized protein n=1 Tax=Desulfomicrobium orale DSM 12838 TaxID=888061 RepID=A0A109W656_9BACT|nr:hypothetical protein [Desulfomicrobium orale]AMD93273.1 hypothetical protein AXF15_09300 [Desulfomicrobium orale DSM 12838]